MTQVLTLIKKDFLLEFRQGYALSGLFVYVLAIVFLVYISFIEIPLTLWNTLYWIIFLFVALNAVLKSFTQESNERYLYYYTLASPGKMLLAKVVYNAMMLLVLGTLLFFGLSIVTQFPVPDAGFFFLCIVLAAVGISLSLTFISAIAIKADNSATLMAILSLPVILPILLNLIRLSAVAMGTRIDNNIWNELSILLSVDLILIGLSIVLFPMLWRA